MSALHEPAVVDGELYCAGCDWSPWGPGSWTDHLSDEVESVIPMSAEDAARLYLRQLRKMNPSPAVLVIIKSLEEDLHHRDGCNAMCGDGEHFHGPEDDTAEVLKDTAHQVQQWARDWWHGEATSKQAMTAIAALVMPEPL